MPNFRKVTNEDFLKNDPLREFHVWWDDISDQEVTELETILESADREEQLQQVLTRIPVLLVQNMKGGHGRWVIPKKKLGSEYVTDFVIGERHSFGFDWVAVELESPKSRMFTKKGNPTKQLTHAIRQIQDWRAWLKRNQDYAARELVKGGLGLTDIDSNIQGMILIGRRNADDSTDELRRQMIQDLKIKIHSYDTLVEWCRSRARYRRK